MLCKVSWKTGIGIGNMYCVEVVIQDSSETVLLNCRDRLPPMETITPWIDWAVKVVDMMDEQLIMSWSSRDWVTWKLITCRIM